MSVIESGTTNALKKVCGLSSKRKQDISLFVLKPQKRIKIEPLLNEVSVVWFSESCSG